MRSPSITLDMSQVEFPKEIDREQSADPVDDELVLNESIVAVKPAERDHGHLQESAGNVNDGINRVDHQMPSTTGDGAENPLLALDPVLDPEADHVIVPNIPQETQDTISSTDFVLRDGTTITLTVIVTIGDTHTEFTYRILRISLAPINTDARQTVDRSNSLHSETDFRRLA